MPKAVFLHASQAHEEEGRTAMGRAEPLLHHPMVRGAWTPTVAATLARSPHP